MTPSNAQLETKLRQHDDEIVAIYDILADIGRTIDEHSAALTGIHGTIDHHSTMLTEILRRLPEAS
ncbi:hypothetical protein P5P86_14840 [Nocardioides sp. BP30]|uniref:hypothetical protein n=1 Tax=Nocardioides sp. BP30 TaxID=3036374 RepID=UPI0024694C6D|nr:hypothetical protein [Nocardioides sp. BP30]WGL51232.1 hypothetical protein P5P86_14840 [Nocardioides sp. BP30]